jgi:NADH-quinone oxidoreductase subunit L
MFQLAWLIPVFPLLAFAVIVLFTNPNKRLSSNIAIGAMALAWVLGIGVFITAIGESKHLGVQPYDQILYTFAPAGASQWSIGWMIDPTGSITLAMVTTVCLMIFIYSQGYMRHEDPDGHIHYEPYYSRFFAYISLFACGMLGFVLSDNLFSTVVFWEIMGLCSYLLIGFWFHKPSAMNAAKKAFLTTRVGDVLFLLGIWTLYAQTGSLSYREIFKPEILARLRDTTISLIPSTWVISFGGLGSLAIPLGVSVALPVATLAALLLFGGAVGKSAQFPLHVWLPDAMEGPTPVSALIHAATMVAAGVFLVARNYPIFRVVEHSTSLSVVTIIGAITALFAATIGVAQNDIKRVLAYSTISQLGYMMMGLGVGAYVAAVFHLITHAFFKALLFLGSGSVIHGVERGMHVTEAHGEHAAGQRWIEAPDPHDANNMYLMGGLRTRMPYTFLTFLIAALALTGIPPFSGFFSKDHILADTFYHGHIIAWAIGTLTVLLTAFYMARQVFLVFTGEPRSAGAHHTAESPLVMTGPLMVLAFFAAVLGVIGVPSISWIHAFHGETETPFTPALAGISILMALGGWFLGYLLYGRQPLAAGVRDPLRRFGGLFTLLRNKYYVDEIYEGTVVRGTVLFSTLNGLIDSRLVDGLVNLAGIVANLFSQLQGWIDNNIVDGIVNLTGTITGELSAGLRLIQTGKVQNYLLVVFLSVLVLAGLFGMVR